MPPRRRYWRHGVPIAERGPGHSFRPDERPPSIVGAHQPGIATPQLDHLSFGAFDVTAERLADLRALLAAWSGEAERMMASPEPLTVTIGLGPGIFDDRFGLTRARPVAMRPLPPFAGDALDPARCGGDLCAQACGRTAELAAATLERLAEAAGGGAVARWTQRGALLRRAGDRPDGTSRDVLGFKGGTANLRRGKDLHRHVWAGGRERSWMLGGTFLVVRRIEVRLDAWRALSVAEQERVIGRHRETGAPIGREHEFELVAAGAGAADARAPLAAPAANAGAALLRRSYSFDDGLLFLAFQRDPARQYVAVQRRLAERDALSRFTRHTGSAVFAIPPGARPGGFLADALVGSG